MKRASIVLLALALVATGCNMPILPPTPTFVVGLETPVTESPTPAGATPVSATPAGTTATTAPVAAATDTPAAGPQGCAWSWNTKPLPDIAEAVQAALDAAGLASAAAVTAFGEDCRDPLTLEVQYFAVMQTDFAVTLEVPDLADLEALGGLAASVLAVLDGFPPAQTPGPNPGQVTLTFVADEYVREARFTVAEAAAARAQGLAGGALLDALHYRP